MDLEISKELQNRSGNIEQMVAAAIKGLQLQAKTEQGGVYDDMESQHLLSTRCLHWEWRIKPDLAQLAYEKFAEDSARNPDQITTNYGAFLSGWNARQELIDTDAN